jgi:hypothetical protein
MLIRSWVHSQLFKILIGPYQLAHQQFFWNIGHAPIKASLWTTSCKIETNVFPLFHLFNLYALELNCGQTIWDKTNVLLGTSCGMHLGTFWKLDGNTLGTRENTKMPLPCPIKKKKKTRSLNHS